MKICFIRVEGECEHSLLMSNVLEYIVVACYPGGPSPARTTSLLRHTKPFDEDAMPCVECVGG